MDLVTSIDEALGGPRVGRCGYDNAAYLNDIGRAGLRRVDGEATAVTELAYVDPTWVDEERVGVDGGHCRLEVQAAGDLGGMNAVAVVGHRVSKLPSRVVVTPGGQADPNVTTDNQDVTTVDGAGRLDVIQWSVLHEGLLDGRSFATTRLGAWSGDDCHLVEYDSYVLDEDRVRQVGFGGQLFHSAPQVCQPGCVGEVLSSSDVDVDRGAFEVGQLAVPNGGADLPGNGDQHRATVVRSPRAALA